MFHDLYGIIPLKTSANEPYCPITLQIKLLLFLLPTWLFRVANT